MATVIDGFWLPQRLRETILTPITAYDTLSFAHGRPCGPGNDGAVTVRWPRLDHGQWQQLLAGLATNRQTAPRGEMLWTHLQAALHTVAQRLADPSDPLRDLALSALPTYTGYSEPMIRFILGALDMMSLDQLPAALSSAPTNRCIADWQRQGLPGRLRFFRARSWPGDVRLWPGMGGRSLFGAAALPQLVVGYGAGNVPGTALLIVLLALATTLAGGAPPVIVVKNSRREPIFSRIVLEALEVAAPQLISTVAVLVWDYEDDDVQKLLLTQADLVIAAASDETIAQIESRLAQAGQGPEHLLRFHPHGHKVSFSAIGQEVLTRGLRDQTSGQAVLDIVTLLASLDSVFWDQQGCLSSRIHFVETGDEGCHTAFDYAERVNAHLRLLAGLLPRGAWPRQQIRDRFDRYKLLETGGQVRVFSTYNDEFLVALDERPLNPQTFRSVVNDCQSRVIIVRPVTDLMEIPERYLPALPPRNLQSLSVAVGRAGEELTPPFLRFAGACGARGVTAIRTVGRGAFPQLAYSWDGLVPLDLVRRRPAGHFTTIEFDTPYEQIVETYRVLQRRAAALGFG